MCTYCGCNFRYGVSVYHGDSLYLTVVVVISDIACLWTMVTRCVCCGCNFRYGVSLDHDDSLCLIVVVVISDTACLWTMVVHCIWFL